MRKVTMAVMKNKKTWPEPLSVQQRAPRFSVCEWSQARARRSPAWRRAGAPAEMCNRCSQWDVNVFQIYVCLSVFACRGGRRWRFKRWKAKVPWGQFGGRTCRACGCGGRETSGSRWEGAGQLAVFSWVFSPNKQQIFLQIWQDTVAICRRVSAQRREEESLGLPVNFILRDIVRVSQICGCLFILFAVKSVFCFFLWFCLVQTRRTTFTWSLLVSWSRILSPAAHKSKIPWHFSNIIW